MAPPVDGAAQYATFARSKKATARVATDVRTLPGMDTSSLWCVAPQAKQVPRRAAGLRLFSQNRNHLRRRRAEWEYLPRRACPAAYPRTTLGGYLEHQVVTAGTRRTRGEATDPLVARMDPRHPSVFVDAAPCSLSRAVISTMVRGGLVLGRGVRGHNIRRHAPAARALGRCFKEKRPVQLRRLPRSSKHQPASCSGAPWWHRRDGRRSGSGSSGSGAFKLGGSTSGNHGLRRDCCRCSSCCSTVAIQATTEEAIFRGYLLQVTGSQIAGWPAVILVSVGFAALHPSTNPFAMANIVLVAAFFSRSSRWRRARSGLQPAFTSAGTGRKATCSACR